MTRYLERAENTSRLLDAGFRIALTRGDQASADDWRSVLITIGQDGEFAVRGMDYTGINVCNFILRDRDNPASVLAMVEMARTNARMVRTAITREVWEATNEAWMALGEVLARPVRESGLGDVLALVRRLTTQVRGASDGTMLRNEIYNFARMGTFIERADNTARILDVKYHVLLPSVAWVGSSLDHVQWETVLRSVAGDRAYHWLNAGRLDARGIAQFLILDQRFPRSLAFCYGKLASNMASLTREYGQEGRACAMLREACAELAGSPIETIIEHGLHEFIVDFIAQTTAIAQAIADDYRFIA